MNNKPLFDQQGFLTPDSFNLWNETLASQIADDHGVILNEQSWLIINTARSYYKLYSSPPSQRSFINFIKQQLGEAYANSFYLIQLFNSSKPLALICKIGGLPKPEYCF